MPKKYHIDVKETPPRFHPVGKFTTVEFREDCAGSCRECVKKNCVYDLFDQNYLHMTQMKRPEYLYACKSCFRCVQECTRGIFTRVINPDYENLGDEYFTPAIVHQTWVQAQTGRVPVSGAGYGGPFTGNGFDSMWTDMSEIVRPTRDGIHGREYINTCVELSAKPRRLYFEGREPVKRALPILEVPLPLIFKKPGFGILGPNVLLSMASAASELGTLMFLEPGDFKPELEPYARNMVPCLSAGNYHAYQNLITGCRMVEIADSSDLKEVIEKIKELNPDVFLSIGLDLDAKAAGRAVELAGIQGVDSLHFYASESGNELNASSPRFVRELIREIHLALVEEGLRFTTSLIFSGGIALAEHLAKAIICGADAVTIDNPLLIALECRLCRHCSLGKPCPVKLGEVQLKWARQRILNLVGAWRNQLIEVMGAMGIREARRLRGEIGRSMWFYDLERESFAPIFGQRKVKGPV